MRMRKRILIYGGILFVLFLLAIAAMPLWFPLITRPVLKAQGVQYDEYERIGYNRLALTDLTYKNDSVQVEAERVEAFLPLTWLWKLWRDVDEEEYATVENWQVEIVDSEKEKPSSDVSVDEVVGMIEKIVPEVIRWVPSAQVGTGEVIIHGRIVEVRGARWQKGAIAGEVHDSVLEQTVRLSADLDDGLPYQLRAEVEPFPLAISVAVMRENGQVVVKSDAEVFENAVTLQAGFRREGYLPERALLQANGFRLPTEYLELEGYDEVLADLRLEWLEEQYSANLKVEAEPGTQNEPFPPLEVKVVAEGDLESVLVETVEIQSPWMTASLSDPVSIRYDGELLSADSVFKVAADLSEQPFVDITGFVTGKVRIGPGSDRVPAADFQLKGEALAGFGTEIKKLALEGGLEWPKLTVTALEVTGMDGTEVEAKAEVDLAEKRILGGSITGTVFPEIVVEWLPEEMGFGEIDVTAEFSGPFTDLQHTGKIQVREAVVPGINLLDANALWEGRMADLAMFQLGFVAGDGQLQLKGRSKLGEKILQLVVEELSLERNEEMLLEAEGATQLVANWGRAEAPLISLDQLHWTTEEGSVEATAKIAWPQQGEFSLKMQGLKPELIADFVDVEVGSFDLRQIEAEGNWNGGPLDFRVLADLSFEFRGESLLIDVDAQGIEQMVTLNRLRASSPEEVLALAEGVLPVYFSPGSEELFQLREYGDLSLRIQTEPETSFWEWLGNNTGLRLMDPDLSVELGGTPFSPIGSIRGTASQIQMERVKEGEQALPVMENLRIALGFDVDGVRLDEASLDIEGQTVQVSASLPLTTEDWQKLVRKRELPDWRQASGRLRIDEAQLGAFARFNPSLLTPQGTMSADVQILPGMMLAGEVTVDNLATRPLLPLGSIQEGTVRIVFDGRTAKVEQISGLLGGERLMIQGDIALPLEQELAFNLEVQGENIPLARRPGLILRADLDLKIVGEPDTVPQISGTVGLRDSFYLANLRLMPTGSVATPGRRPPFFTVSEEPFKDWLLNVELKGPEFLTVRGSIFRGLLSANFHLEGTLEEPRAIGSVIIENGKVNFPFASMEIIQGEVTLAPENPFQPKLFVVATSTTFGYDLRMEITGTGDSPIIEFTSSPPLTSEEALLMVSAGDIPRDDASFTTQQKASKFAVYIGQNLLYEITGDDSAADRLIIRSGEHISEQGRETMAIEYKLSEKWSVIGEYDRFDEYNAGLKWNIFSR